MKSQATVSSRVNRGERAPRRLLAILGVTAIVAATALVTAAAPVSAYETAVNAWGPAVPPPGSTTAVAVTLPSGLTITGSAASPSSVSGGVNQGLFGALPTMFKPDIGTSTPAFALAVNGTNCAPGGLCPAAGNLGTITIGFSRPVTNPVLHFSGIGGVSTSGSDSSAYGARLTLTGATPAAPLPSLGPVSGNSTNLQVVGNTISRANTTASTDCGVNAAGCGSVAVLGTVTSVTFALSMDWAIVSGSGNATSTPTDTVAVSVTVGQDYSDAPASYNGANSQQAPMHVIGDLRMGTDVDEDNNTAPNAAASPFTASGTAVNGAGDNVSGADEDAINLPWPPLTTKMIGSVYSVNVPLRGASQAGLVCGYIDFAHAGTFTAPEDSACTLFQPNTSSVTLNWPVPGSMTAGTTYARLRAAYDTQANSPIGLASSGEVEDYEITILPTVTVNKVLPSGAAGTFDLAVNGKTLATNIGNGGTTGTKTLGVTTPTLTTPDIPGAIEAGSTMPVTVSESPSAGNNFAYTTAYSCVDGNGAIVPNGTGTSRTSTGLTIPASNNTPGQANGRAQSITCTFTNTGVPSLALVKTANPTTISGPGQTVTYGFAVTNTGPLTLTNLTIADTFTTGGSGTVGPINCPATTLAPLATTTCTGTYISVQADVDAGSIRNTAIATGTPPSGPPVNSPPSSAVVTVVQSPGLTLVKSANVSTITNIGDPVKYSFVVTNTGNVTLTNVTITDTFAAPASPPLTISCPLTTLTAAGTGATSTMTCTANYVSTAADFGNGKITNTAIGTGTPPVGPPVVTPPSTVVILTTPTASLSIVKSASPATIAVIGDPVTYTFVVTNTGNVTLTDVSISDIFVPPAGPELTIICPTTTLTAAGTGSTSQMTCTSMPYISTGADFTVGKITNSATATGTPPVGPPITSPPSTFTVITVTALPPTGLSNLRGAVFDGLGAITLGFGLVLLASRRRRLA